MLLRPEVHYQKITLRAAAGSFSYVRSELRLSGRELVRHLRNLALLPDAEVQHDLLGPARHGHCANLAGEALDLLALAAAGVAEPAEDLRALPRAVLEDLGALHLEERR